ncbi:TPA: inovirus Gp2 family protein [Klebsiella variicola]|uniref:inovirus-type Gp2 protein n=1 Tax=Klebsiella variicola TaxID=244366 RepID=UPI001BA4A683|nr:inovirus-type Gp2 protein [Klebsiella variicola]MBR7248821.1 inovirus Gp2 family protein [Klebsiella variicola]HBY0419014.1 inovirus Gp2 family protein [Klebsiella variicola]HCB1330671.1 inovirus-type Gp2 protein [Klebsiella variicola subsp. variicola]
MDFPWPWNRKYTMNWFLLSLLNHHLDQLLERYSRLQPLRLDVFYQNDTWRYNHHGWYETEREVRQLTEHLMLESNIVGHFWVLECTSRHKCHAHIVMYLDGHHNQATFPVAEQAGAVWQKITQGEGYHNRCDPKKCYEADITRPINYDDAAAIDNLRYIISYLAKEKSKHGQTYYGASEVPPASGLGRPRGLR